MRFLEAPPFRQPDVYNAEILEYIHNRDSLRMQEALPSGMPGSSDALAYKVGLIPDCAAYLAQDSETLGLNTL